MMSPHSCALPFFWCVSLRTHTISLSLSHTHTHFLILVFFSLTHAHPFCLFFSRSLSFIYKHVPRAHTHTHICTQCESTTWLGDLPCLRCLTLICPTEAGCITTPAVMSFFCPDVACGAWGKYPRTVRPSETPETETKRQLMSTSLGKSPPNPLSQYYNTNIAFLVIY